MTNLYARGAWGSCTCYPPPPPHTPTHPSYSVDNPCDVLGHRHGMDICTKQHKMAKLVCCKSFHPSPTPRQACSRKPSHVRLVHLFVSKVIMEGHPVHTNCFLWVAAMAKRCTVRWWGSNHHQSADTLIVGRLYNSAISETKFLA